MKNFPLAVNGPQKTLPAIHIAYKHTTGSSSD